MTTRMYEPELTSNPLQHFKTPVYLASRNQFVFFFKVPKFQHHLKIWKNNSVFTVGLPMLGSTTHRYFLTTLRYLGLFLVARQIPYASQDQVQPSGFVDKQLNFAIPFYDNIHNCNTTNFLVLYKNGSKTIINLKKRRSRHSKVRNIYKMANQPNKHN